MPADRRPAHDEGSISSTLCHLASCRRFGARVAGGIGLGRGPGAQRTRNCPRLLAPGYLQMTPPSRRREGATRHVPSTALNASLEIRFKNRAAKSANRRGPSRAPWATHGGGGGLYATLRGPGPLRWRPRRISAVQPPRPAGFGLSNKMSDSSKENSSKANVRNSRRQRKPSTQDEGRLATAAAGL